MVPVEVPQPLRGRKKEILAGHYPRRAARIRRSASVRSRRESAGCMIERNGSGKSCVTRAHCASSRDASGLGQKSTACSARNTRAPAVVARASSVGMRSSAFTQHSIARQTPGMRVLPKRSRSARSIGCCVRPRVRQCSMRATSHCSSQPAHSPATLHRLKPTAGETSNLHTDRTCEGARPSRTQKSAVRGMACRVSVSRKWSAIAVHRAMR